MEEQLQGQNDESFEHNQSGKLTCMRLILRCFDVILNPTSHSFSQQKFMATLKLS
jgi:hypothetical protein